MEIMKYKFVCRSVLKGLCCGPPGLAAVILPNLTYGKPATVRNNKGVGTKSVRNFARVLHTFRKMPRKTYGGGSYNNREKVFGLK